MEVCRGFADVSRTVRVLDLADLSVQWSSDGRHAAVYDDAGRMLGVGTVPDGGVPADAVAGACDAALQSGRSGGDRVAFRNPYSGQVVVGGQSGDLVFEGGGALELPTSATVCAAGLRLADGVLRCVSPQDGRLLAALQSHGHAPTPPASR